MEVGSRGWIVLIEEVKLCMYDFEFGPTQISTMPLGNNNRYYLLMTNYGDFVAAALPRELRTSRKYSLRTGMFLGACRSPTWPLRGGQQSMSMQWSHQTSPLIPTI